MRRTAAALLSAVAVQPLLVFIWLVLPALVRGGKLPIDQMLTVSFYSVAVAIPFVLLIGLPTALWLNRIGKFRWRYLATIGFLAGALPMFFFLPGGDPAYSSGGNFHGTYVRFIVDGVPTLYGWLSYLQVVLTFGLHGLVGASAFYLVSRPAPSNPEAPISGDVA